MQSVEGSDNDGVALQLRRQIDSGGACDAEDVGGIVEADFLLRLEVIDDVLHGSVLFFLGFRCIPSETDVAAQGHRTDMEWFLRRFLVDEGHEGL